MHLIPEPIVDGRVLLQRFGKDFWEMAQSQFGISQDAVQGVIDGQKQSQTLDNFMAGTRIFHTVFDGLYGTKVKIPNGVPKKEQVDLGGDISVIATVVSIGKRGSMEPSDLEKNRRCAPVQAPAHSPRTCSRQLTFLSTSFRAGQWSRSGLSFCPRTSMRRWGPESNPPKINIV